MDEIKGIARVKFHPGRSTNGSACRNRPWRPNAKMKEELAKGGPKLFTPWIALQDQELAQKD